MVLQKQSKITKKPRQNEVFEKMDDSHKKFQVKVFQVFLLPSRLPHLVRVAAAGAAGGLQQRQTSSFHWLTC